MKLHSGSMNQLASSISSQSSEGKPVEHLQDPVTCQTNGKLQVDEDKNSSEENADKMSLTEHLVPTTDRDDRPKGSA